VLQFLQGFRFNLSDSLAGYTHHFANFFQGERSEVACDPGTVEKCLILQTPFTGGILAYFLNENAGFPAFIKIIQGTILLWEFEVGVRYEFLYGLSIIKKETEPLFPRRLPFGRKGGSQEKMKTA
jgi:hypothetical protein